MPPVAVFRESMCGNPLNKEKRHDIGNCTVDRSGFTAARCDSNLAAQPWLGLWPEWASGRDLDRCAYFVFYGADMSPDFVRS